MKRIEIPMGVSRGMSFQFSAFLVFSHVNRKSLYFLSAFRAFSGGDDGIETNSSTIGLVCPLSRKRIELPVRGRDCGHLECFDARNYVDLNHHTKAKWTCPRCSDSVSLEDLVVDEYAIFFLFPSLFLKKKIIFFAVSWRIFCDFLLKTMWNYCRAPSPSSSRKSSKLVQWPFPSQVRF
jgi:hypothetical protein